MTSSIACAACCARRAGSAHDNARRHVDTFCAAGAVLHIVSAAVTRASILRMLGSTEQPSCVVMTKTANAATMRAMRVMLWDRDDMPIMSSRYAKRDVVMTTSAGYCGIQGMVSSATGSILRSDSFAISAPPLMTRLVVLVVIARMNSLSSRPVFDAMMSPPMVTSQT